MSSELILSILDFCRILSSFVSIWQSCCRNKKRNTFFGSLCRSRVVVCNAETLRDTGVELSRFSCRGCRMWTTTSTSSCYVSAFCLSFVLFIFVRCGGLRQHFVVFPQCPTTCWMLTPVRVQCTLINVIHTHSFHTASITHDLTGHLPDHC